MSNEIALALGWIVTTAQGDTALAAAASGGVWQGFADDTTATPYVLCVHQSGSDVTTANAVRLFSRLLFQIKAIAPATSMSTLVTIANRIDALFGSARSVALSSGGVLEAWRTQPLQYSELVNGVHYVHLGGLYQVDLQGS